MIDDIEFMRPIGADRDVTALGVVVDAVDVEIIARRHAEIDVESPWIVSDALPLADIVIGSRRAVLYHVVLEMVLPDDIAISVNLYDGIHLDTLVTVGGIRVGAQFDDFVVGQGSIRDKENRVVLEFGVVHPQKIVMRVVALTPLRILPERITVPVLYRERSVADRAELV